MRKLAVIDFLSLDGVMQAPGQPDEDTEGGFRHGGWAIPYHDEGLAKSVADSMEATDAYLFGRKTFENFAAYWPTAPREIPFTDHLNNGDVLAVFLLELADLLDDITVDHSRVLPFRILQRLRHYVFGGVVQVVGEGDLPRCGRPVGGKVLKRLATEQICIGRGHAVGDTLRERVVVVRDR